MVWKIICVSLQDTDMDAHTPDLTRDLLQDKTR